MNLDSFMRKVLHQESDIRAAMGQNLLITAVSGIIVLGFLLSRINGDAPRAQND